jgi:MATE family multidrug resistance protein
LPSFDRIYNTQRSYAFNWSKMRGLIRIGAPTSLGWLVDVGSWMMFLMLIVPNYGQVAMAASNVALQYMHLCFMPAIGIGIALSSKVGFVIGEGQPDEAERWTMTAFRLSGLYMGAVGAAIFLFRDSLIWIFNDDPAVILVGSKVLIWVAIFQIFDAMMIVYMNSLRGAGDTKVPNIIVASCCWGLFIGGGLFMAKFVPSVGIHGAWGACTTYIITLGLLLMWRWYSGAWRHIKLFDDRPAKADDQAVVAAASAPAVELEAPEAIPDPAPAGADR